MKKVLILTVTAGNGHNSAANAVKEACAKRDEKVEIKYVDLLHELCDSKTFIWVQATGYALACQYLCGIYNWFFRQFQKADPKKYYKSSVQNGLMKMYGKLLKLIYDFQPDAIYCSHFLPCIMISNLRKDFDIPAKVYSFIFDFVVCPFWEAGTGIDYLLIPNENFEEEMIRKGFKKEQLLPWGLTVNEKFSLPLDKAEAREELGLDKDLFTIFVMFGGGFWSGNYKIVKTLLRKMKKPVQIYVANGRDEKGKKKIDKLKVPNHIKLHNMGFCRNVDVIMSASDVIVGKAGGVSVTECSNKVLPMVCCKKLPEQEKQNVERLKKLGMAKQYRNSKEMVAILNEMIDNPAILKNMRLNIKGVRRPDATVKVAEAMLNAHAEYKNVDVDFSKVNQIVRKHLKSLRKGGGE